VFALDGLMHWGGIGLPERRGRKGYAEDAKEDKKGEKKEKKRDEKTKTKRKKYKDF
jgi:hypothetical protein